MMYYSKINKDDYTDFAKDEGKLIWRIYPIYDAEDDVFLFSFDKEVILNFADDYPHNFTEEQRKIFRKEYDLLAELRD